MILSITRPSNAAACESFLKNSKNYENHFVKAVPLVVTVLLSLNFLQETKKKKNNERQQQNWNCDQGQSLPTPP